MSAVTSTQPAFILQAISAKTPTHTEAMMSVSEIKLIIASPDHGFPEDRHIISVDQPDAVAAYLHHVFR